MKKLILVVALIFIQTTSPAQNTLDAAIMNHDVAAVLKFLSDTTLILDKESALKKARTEFDNAETALEGPAKLSRLLFAFTLLTLGSYLGLKQIPRLRGTVIEYNSQRLTYVGSRILAAISVAGLGTGIVQLLMSIFSKTHEELQSDLAQAQKIIQLLKQHKEEL